MLTGKHIALYVSGGIAVYKAATLVRTLIKRGAEVRVALTQGATAFVTPLTFQTLSKHDVYTDRFKQFDAEHVAHIDLADWSDLAIVAPATADVIGKMANGITDDFVTTALLATTAPKFVAPAMNNHMLASAAVQRNLKQLQADGVTLIDPETGFLAEGYEGKGRLPEPETIADFVEVALLQQAPNLPFAGKQFVITAGGTQEKIDPVRYITNKSSGKMGYALAVAARDLGAKVTLITASDLPNPFGMTVVQAPSAEEMAQQVFDRFQASDVVIMAAAISDYRPVQPATEKIKKQAGHQELVLTLTETPDILAQLGQTKQHQLVIGFAAETQHLLDNAAQKLARKQADMLIANDVAAANVGFDYDTNAVTILRPQEAPLKLPLASKTVIAQQIMEIIRQMRFNA
ncbi:bifunctional phosphopantothenoylcysteine decarboxylase/phosphopantothenate--cysteine ligase CoaBC [Loigolactobacillus bifermentans]|uniref:Coenzyme A biosynthesis bifunctional protein CoaBC n=1 Tax=Loigolactobacillus bifermentans DSM 20003 TaxID=1423726 RepID=A0A0R1H7Z7_9LACO|nr:bifunctional phosphopantothenoylcysteine decarboxylase/phosphopantothenate--cysteine ligase CoaBC [Loigolactobacillus bifermentans]KRK40755.1 coenzyme A biosynthesis bifunctional protein CoaBC [Loigolactobacillus bifermentans DSM 20003]QGG59506.1 bifunctional phosphopantothenoylcysteine decarboxylase/phosphopantothenate--cysteine ligase CoaBC [Loigolactobacillus bifermentans]